VKYGGVKCPSKKSKDYKKLGWKSNSLSIILRQFAEFKVKQ
jgi:hypothetical protein